MDHIRTKLQAPIFFVFLIFTCFYVFFIFGQGFFRAPLNHCQKLASLSLLTGPYRTQRPCFSTPRNGFTNQVGLSMIIQILVEFEKPHLEFKHAEHGDDLPKTRFDRTRHINPGPITNDGL